MKCPLRQVITEKKDPLKNRHKNADVEKKETHARNVNEITIKRENKVVIR